VILDADEIESGAIGNSYLLDYRGVGLGKWNDGNAETEARTARA
jgi:hypothetical protein